MSRIEHHIGTITEIKTDDLEKTMREILSSQGMDEKPDCYPTVERWFRTEIWEDYLLHNGKIYKVESTELDEGADIRRLTREGDIIKFESRFYNGGACLNETIQQMLKDEEKTKEDPGAS